MRYKNSFVLTAITAILSACSLPTAPAIDSTKITPPTSINDPLPKTTPLLSEIPQSTDPYGITNSLDRHETSPGGTILYGNISWTDPLIPPYGASTLLVSIKDVNGMEVPFENADVKDANGNVIPFEGANSGIYPDPQDDHRQYWAYKLKGANLVTPLSLTFIVTANLPVDGGSFTFDPGPNPPLGQKWDINQDVVVNNEIVHIFSAEQAGIEEGYFLFTMQSDSNIVSASITDFDHPPAAGGGGGGGGIPQAGVPFQSGFGYQMPLPHGPYTLTFTNVGILVSGDWTLTWSP